MRIISFLSILLLSYDLVSSANAAKLSLASRRRPILKDAWSQYEKLHKALEKGFYTGENRLKDIDQMSKATRKRYWKLRRQIREIELFFEDRDRDGGERSNKIYEYRPDFGPWIPGDGTKERPGRFLIKDHPDKMKNQAWLDPGQWGNPEHVPVKARVSEEQFQKRLAGATEEVEFMDETNRYKASIIKMRSARAEQDFERNKQVVRDGKFDLMDLRDREGLHGKIIMNAENPWIGRNDYLYAKPEGLKAGQTSLDTILSNKWNKMDNTDLAGGADSEAVEKAAAEAKGSRSFLQRFLDFFQGRWKFWS